MNVFTASGNLGKDVRLANVNGTDVANFNVAVRSGYGQNEQTLWLDCALWGKRAEALGPYLVKGQTVVVSGELGTREHEGKTYLTLRVGELTLVGKRSDNETAKPQQKSNAQLDDDIPF